MPADLGIHPGCSLPGLTRVSDRGDVGGDDACGGSVCGGSRRRCGDSYTGSGLDRLHRLEDGICAREGGSGRDLHEHELRQSDLHPSRGSAFPLGAHRYSEGLCYQRKLSLNALHVRGLVGAPPHTATHGCPPNATEYSFVRSPQRVTPTTPSQPLAAPSPLPLPASRAPPPCESSPGSRGARAARARS